MVKTLDLPTNSPLRARVSPLYTLYPSLKILASISSPILDPHLSFGDKNPIFIDV